MKTQQVTRTTTVNVSTIRLSSMIRLGHGHIDIQPGYMIQRPRFIRHLALRWKETPGFNVNIKFIGIPAGSKLEPLMLAHVVD